MTNAGIQNDDLLIVDRSLEPQPGNIVVAVLEGRFILKRIIKNNHGLYLQADQPNYPMIDISNYDNAQIWGIVTYSIHRAKRKYW